MLGYYYIILLNVINLINPTISGGSLKLKKECPEFCHCLGYYVDCAANKFETIPINIPKWTTHLDLHNNLIRKLTDYNLKNLSLIELNLNKNNINSITNNAFQNLQKTLKILELNHNQLHIIDALVFKSLENLIILKLKRNQIIQLKDGSFYGLLNLNKLILDYNYIQIITKGWLYGLKKLNELLLSHNNINRIENDSWEFCPELKILDLSFNELKFITLDTFKNLEMLQKLLLNNNNISFIEENSFNHLKNLKILNLNNNKLSWTIEDSTNGIYRGLINLLKLHLTNNNIKTINNKAFVGLKNLTLLNLTNNNISTISTNSFNDLINLQQLVINTTNLLCDCNLITFKVYLDGVMETRNFQTSLNLICSYPNTLIGQSLFNLTINQLKCDTNDIPKPRLIEQPEPEIMALKGENISLSCIALINNYFNNNTMLIQWKKDNFELISDNNENYLITNEIKKTSKSIQLESKLNLFNVQHLNAGKYQCVVINNYGSIYSQKSLIKVLIFPQFLKKPQNITVELGQTAKLECAVNGEPQPEIAWQKDGGNDFPAARERRMHVMPTDDVFFITDIKSSDMGIYSCTGHNIAGTIIANASLIVQEKPSFVKLMENKQIKVGELIVLECMASGIPKPTIKWLKDGNEIKINERHFFTAEDQLMIIVDTVIDDTGRYECHLNNSLGSVIGYSHLIVKLNEELISFSKDIWGIIIITAVCCAVATSITWVVIIYQTRKRCHIVTTTGTITNPIELTTINNDMSNHMMNSSNNMMLTRFNDNLSENSSCKDSGTGDCINITKNNSTNDDDLLLNNSDDFTLTINTSQSNCKIMRTASLVYLTSDCDNYHTVLLHSDGICTCLNDLDTNSDDSVVRNCLLVKENVNKTPKTIISTTTTTPILNDDDNDKIVD